MDAVCADQKYNISVQVEAASFETILTLVKANLGFTVLPAAAIREELVSGEFQASLLTGPEVTRTLILATPNNRPPMRGLYQVTSAIKAELGKLEMVESEAVAAQEAGRQKTGQPNARGRRGLAEVAEDHPTSGWVSEGFPSAVPSGALAEAAGFERIGIADSPSLYLDPFAATRRLHVGPRVTNPVLRHPVVTASALATLAEASGGRVFMGIGTGHSAVLNVGLKPVKIEALREFVLAVRGLLQDGQAQWQGAALKMDWWMGRLPIPIYVAAAGPKGLEVAGELADGVIIGNGMTPEVLAADLECVARGARKSGREPSDLYLQWLMATCLAEDAEQAGREARAQQCSNPNQVFRGGIDTQLVPPEYQDKVRMLTRQYRPNEHVRPGETRHNAQLVDDLGLRGYLIDRFGIVGTPEQRVERIRSLQERGVNNFWMSVPTADKERVIRLLADRVLPHFL